MDPLIKILPELHEMVIQHFNAADFKNITKVSPSWNEKLSDTKIMMEKVKFSIDPVIIYRLLEAVIGSAFKCTIRRYQNMRIQFCMSRCPFSQKVLKYLLDSGEALRGLEIEYLVELSAENAEFFCELDLSKLKFLNLNFVTDELTDKVLGRCSSLISLYLCGMITTVWNITSVPTLRSFLERNNNLKILELCSEYYEVFFIEDISEIATFQLESLKIKNSLRSQADPENIDRNLIKFLERQSQSLESLSITFCSESVVKHIFNKMAALKYLTIQNNNFRSEDLWLNLNENITELSIPNLLAVDIAKIIPNVPNLVKLHINALSERNIEIIGRHLSALRELIYNKQEVDVDGPMWASLWPREIPVCRLVPLY